VQLTSPADGESYTFHCGLTVNAPAFMDDTGEVFPYPNTPATVAAAMYYQVHHPSSQDHYEPLWSQAVQIVLGSASEADAQLLIDGIFENFGDCFAKFHAAVEGTET